ncbi:MAG: hypothetical protein K2J78_02005, partial [Muribaculaceae bacterium]|nr:hypothetical protein [Muribaculaceae bacterium]
SQWYAFIFLILSVHDTDLDWHTVRIPPGMFGTASILELKRFLLRQKRARMVQVCIGLPLAIIWVIAFFSAMRANTDLGISGDATQAAKIGGLFCGVIGGVIGGIVVLVLYRKMQRTNDTLLSDIYDLESEK